MPDELTGSSIGGSLPMRHKRGVLSQAFEICRVRPRSTSHPGSLLHAGGGSFNSVQFRASGERNSMTPGATHITWTRWPGLKPARSSQRPRRRILGLIPFQRSPSASICSVRTLACDSIPVPDCRSPGIAVSKSVRRSHSSFSGDWASGQVRAPLSVLQQSLRIMFYCFD